MAISRVLTPAPQLGPAPAIPAANFTKLANELTRPAQHAQTTVPTNGPSQHHEAASARAAGKSHKVDHAV
jgi:hypothetical protein